MSESKFTPGPWYVDGTFVTNDEDLDICSMGDVAWEANAHLIAAAPDLYEALKNTTAHLVAAHSLLQSGGEKAAASNTMLEIMLKDYKKSIEVGRAALKKLEDV